MLLAHAEAGFGSGSGLRFKVCLGSLSGNSILFGVHNGYPYFWNCPFWGSPDALSGSSLRSVCSVGMGPLSFQEAPGTVEPKFLRLQGLGFWGLGLGLAS